jgi:drug/metabolite transporter (DMT)-like permease
MVDLLLIFAVIFWGLSFVATKMALQYLTPFEIVAVRLLLGFSVLYSILRIKKMNFTFTIGDYRIILISSFLLGVHFIIQAFGLIYTTATNTAWLIATIPVFIIVPARIFFGERLGGWKIIGVVAATGGVLLIISRGELANLSGPDSLGDWIILSSCITWSIYTLVTRDISRKHNPLKVVVAIMILPTAALTVIMLLSGSLRRFIDLPLNIILALIFLGIFCLGLAHWFWLEALSRKGAGRTGVYLYIEPIITTLAATAVLNEKITTFIIVGAILIISGVYMVDRKPSLPARKARR